MGKDRFTLYNVSKILVVLTILIVLSGCNQELMKGVVDNMSLESLLEPMQKSSIKIAYNVNYDGESPIGSSKIGGKPDLPPDFEWFYYKGESYDGSVENRPLSFIAQINCEEVREYDKDSLLPSKGILYFFYELATMTWGFDPKDKGSAKVYYFSGDISDISRTEFPSDLLDEYKIPEMSISFSSAKELPDFEEFTEWYDGFEYEQWDEYDETKFEMGFESELGTEEDEKLNKLLGYADLIQGGPLLQCELTTNGINTGTIDGYSKISAQQKENSKKWCLLFQLDSIETGNYEMLWGDVGRIYYYINTDDLVKMNFDNCWLILQCY